LDWDARHTSELDEGLRRVFLNNCLYHPFQEELLEEHVGLSLVHDEAGMVVRRPKDFASLPAYVRGPVGSRENWERLKAERLQPTMKGRLPDNCKDLVEEHRDRSYPLAVGGGQGLFGTPRSLFGEVQG
jgi:hypothetical protein